MNLPAALIYRATTGGTCAGTLKACAQAMLTVRQSRNGCAKSAGVKLTLKTVNGSAVIEDGTADTQTRNPIASNEQDSEHGAAV